SASSTPMFANPSTCALLAVMSCRKNSRSSITSSPARRRMILASTLLSFFFPSRSVMGNPGQFIHAQGMIDVVHRLGCGAFQKVVECRDDHHAPAIRGYPKA